jgi:hypothetical protein
MQYPEPHQEILARIGKQDIVIQRCDLCKSYSYKEDIILPTILRCRYCGSNTPVRHPVEATEWTKAFDYAYWMYFQYGYMLSHADDWGWNLPSRYPSTVKTKVAEPVYGVNCELCNIWCPDAEKVDGFRCYSCRSDYGWMKKKK